MSKTAHESVQAPRNADMMMSSELKHLQTRVDEQAVLIRDMDHRLRKLPAFFEALAQQTASLNSDDDVAESLVGRMAAVAGVYRLLARQKWQTVDLSDIVENIVNDLPSPLRERVVIAVERRTLSADTAIAMTLALHELLRHSRRHGALNTDHAQVAIRWHRNEEFLVFLWDETGAPPTGNAGLSGFGKDFLTRGLSYELDAVTKIEPRPGGGLHVRVQIPLSVLRS